MDSWTTARRARRAAGRRGGPGLALAGIFQGISRTSRDRLGFRRAFLGFRRAFLGFLGILLASRRDLTGFLLAPLGLFASAASDAHSVPSSFWSPGRFGAVWRFGKEQQQYIYIYIYVYIYIYIYM